MLKKIKELLKEKGQGIVEYGLILGFVAIVAVSLFASGGLKEKVSGTMGAVGNELSKMSDVIKSGTNNIGGGTKTTPVVTTGGPDQEAG